MSEEDGVVLWNRVIGMVRVNEPGLDWSDEN
jgi:hypothetical protein